VTLAPRPTVAPRTRFVSCLAVAATWLLLAGCAVTTSVSDDRKTRAPARIGALTLGQPAQIYFRELPPESSVEADLAAWRQSGLFSSVTQATRPDPDKTGIFIRVDCDHYRSVARSPGFSVALWFMTLGTFPIRIDDVEYSCKLAMFQDALPIASAVAELNYVESRNGWSLIPAWLGRERQRQALAQDAAVIRVNNMLQALK
jgi:hypothetical protein